MRKIGSIICFALILFLFFSCSKKDDWKGKIEYIDNIKVVTNHNKGIWEESEKGKKMIFTEVVAIGGLEEEENQLYETLISSAIFD